MKYFKYSVYLILGTLFGVVLIQSELASWFRIQEMFWFQSYELYKVIGSAVLVATVGKFIIRVFALRTPFGERVKLKRRKFNKGLIYGSIIFGIGWGLCGVCPGPIYAIMGRGVLSFTVLFVSAFFGTFIFSIFSRSFPR